MTNRIFKILIAFIVLLLFAGCGGSRWVEITDAGEVNGGIYTNKDLSLVMELPLGWTHQDNNTGFLDALESELPKHGLMPMLKINQYEGRGVAGFPQFLLYTRSKDSIADYAKDEDAYLRLVASALEQKYYKCIFDDITQREISGHKFYVLSSELIDSDLITTYRTVLIGEKQGNYIIIAISYLDMDQFELAANLLGNIQFVE